jgi:hypothetical protein
LKKYPGKVILFAVSADIISRKNGKDYNMDGTDRGLPRAADFVS